MTKQEIDRIESAIRHIQTSTDIDPWAAEIAVEAMQKQIPHKAMKSIDVYDKNLYKLYCPTCGALVANGNSRVGFMNKVSKWYDRCAKCGQVIDWKAAERTDHIADSGKKVERTGKPSQDVSDSDLISRKAAVADTVHMELFDRDYPVVPVGVLNSLPSAQSEHKGEWVGVRAYCDHLNEEAKANGRTERYLPSGMVIGVYCNKCWCRADKKSDFCPNCGADMRKERKG